MRLGGGSRESHHGERNAGNTGNERLEHMKNLLEKSYRVVDMYILTSFFKKASSSA
jgi:hypothetical protein